MLREQGYAVREAIRFGRVLFAGRMIGTNG